MQTNKSSLSKASKKQSRTDHFFKVVRFAQGRGEIADLSRQVDQILYRIARGNGHPIPLPAIQRGDFGKFVSDPQARIRDLRAIGFVITCDTHFVDGERQSTYVLELNADGTPKMRASADVITEQPKQEKGSAWRGFRFGAQPDTSRRLLWETGNAR